MTEKKEPYKQPDPPHPGESLDSFLHRHRAHPSDENPRTASEEDMAQFDKTADYEKHGFIITKK